MENTRVENKSNMVIKMKSFFNRTYDALKSILVEEKIDDKVIANFELNHEKAKNESRAQEQKYKNSSVDRSGRIQINQIEINKNYLGKKYTKTKGEQNFDLEQSEK